MGKAEFWPRKNARNIKVAAGQNERGTEKRGGAETSQGVLETGLSSVTQFVSKVRTDAGPTRQRLAKRTSLSRWPPQWGDNYSFRRCRSVSKMPRQKNAGSLNNMVRRIRKSGLVGKFTWQPGFYMQSQVICPQHEAWIHSEGSTGMEIKTIGGFTLLRLRLN